MSIPPTAATKTNTELAMRFVSCYNAIDKLLRNIYNIKPSLSFTEVLRISSSRNAIVRKYEDDLFAYSRLRNAIVHNTYNDMIIAEPHVEVVERLEYILKVVKAPPLATDILGAKRVITCDARDSAYDILLSVSKNQFSNIPVIDGDCIKGILNPKDLVAKLGDRLYKKAPIDENYLKSITAGDLLDKKSDECAFVSTAASVNEVLSLFMANRKLKAVVITRFGDNTAPALNIATGADVITFNEVLDNY